MNIKELTLTLKKLPANQSVLIRGRHGIGKSEVVKQLAEFWELPLIDRRISQMSEGDIIGLPKVENGKTEFLPPEWFRQAMDEPVTLFLDELNRGTPEVMQACFELVLDRSVMGKKVHPGTRIMAAINHTADYQVNAIDPALLDRFYVVDLVPSDEEFIEWGKSAKIFNDIMVEFFRQHSKHIEHNGAIEAHRVYPSRRSWARLAQALRGAGIIDDPENELFYKFTLGFVGVETAQAFQSFASNFDKQLPAEAIFKDYAKIKNKLKKASNERLMGMVEKVVDYLEKTDINADEADNFKLFADDLPNEMFMKMFSSLPVTLSKAGKSRNLQLVLARIKGRVTNVASVSTKTTKK